MAGLTSTLNIAKNSLLAFQLATQVIGHNISNVNNEAYSRQKVVETTYPPSPSPVGPIGTGVRIDYIKRYFDSFLERNLNLKYTDFGLYNAEEAGLNVLESLFNEVTEGVGLTSVLKNFWASWQSLANAPENLAARTQVLENGKLITEILKSKFQGLRDLETQIGLKLKNMADNINKISSQIAELNLQITALESGGKTANDLRDQRDALIRQLSQLASIQYFETKEGAYNVVLGKGFNLVNLDRTWKLEISGTDLYWVDSSGAKVPLSSKEVSSGELGGWLRLLEQLSDKYNYEYVSGNKINYNLFGKLISEGDKLSDLGLSGIVNFNITGTDHLGNSVSGSISYDLTTTPNATLRDLLDKIEELYNYTVKAYIKDGRLFIEDNFRGPGKLEFSMSGPVDFGGFSDPAYQRRVEELNLAGKLKLFGEELVKAVNELHTQGVGLTFYEGELEGAYSVKQYLKELPYFLDLSKNPSGTELTGFFYVWVKNPQGQIVPVKISVEGLSVNATLDDLANRINEGLQQAGFYDPANPNAQYLKALVRGGKLVFQAKEGFAYAFSNDTSGILLSTGINLFFLGTDPEDLSVNNVFVLKPELIASGKMDLASFRTETSLFKVYKSFTTIDANQTFDNSLSKIFLRFYDDKINQVSLFDQNPSNEKVFFVLEGNVSEEIKLTDLGFANNTIITYNGTLYDGTAVSGSFQVSPFSTVKDLMNSIKTTYNNTVEVYIKNGMLIIENKNPGDSSLTFNSDELAQNTYFGSSYRWNLSPSGEYFVEVSVRTNETLSSIFSKIDRLPYIRAYIDADGKAVISLEPNQTKTYAFEIGDNSSTNGFIDFLTTQNMYIPSFRGDPDVSINRVSTGFEDFILDNTREDYLSFYLFDKKGDYIDTFRIRLDDGKTILDVIKEINSPENARYGLSARLDREGKLIIETTGLYQTATFVVQDETSYGTNYIQKSFDQGFINKLKGYEFKRGDNRTAQAIADLASVTRKSLNYATLEDYYSSLIGEVGAATKAVKDSKSFLETLISQIKAIKDSVSGVSLDEEMTNLIKYQQAFAAAAKLLTSVEDMLENLINAKR
ncbi:flagellar hook-associated protein FlgK [Thermodesulfobacterium sp. TA1]|uniref:flagellar hook-associated protein FlgK n=1 Tax=Thermodesulfobacterium sp. TA1 TaxID=2234087 RepID=UPI001232240F|nr:flagellar hook-associated protein FlgK [Thermodesulfobacterium sp. TA1]QER42376.1 flagellar hook-associated protein FlgK [Thermodesulfobacterium sp. TA1]